MRDTPAFPPPDGVALALVFTLPLRVRWQGGMIWRAEWGDANPGVVDPFTQQLVAECLATPSAAEPYLPRPASHLAEQLRKALWDIPAGRQLTYGQLAAQMGHRGARGVAAALAANQWLWLIPCHRVVRADGSLGGYRGGMARKQWILAHEQRHPAAQPRYPDATQGEP